MNSVAWMQESPKSNLCRDFDTADLCPSMPPSFCLVTAVIVDQCHADAKRDAAQLWLHQNLVNILREWKKLAIWELCTLKIHWPFHLDACWGSGVRRVLFSSYARKKHQQLWHSRVYLEQDEWKSFTETELSRWQSLESATKGILGILHTFNQVALSSLNSKDPQDSSKAGFILQNLNTSIMHTMAMNTSNI